MARLWSTRPMHFFINYVGLKGLGGLQTASYVQLDLRLENCNLDFPGIHVYNSLFGGLRDPAGLQAASEVTSGLGFELSDPKKLCFHVSGAGTCKTTDWTMDPGKPCVFPFVHKGVLYNGCTQVDNNNVAWCSTALDSTGVYISDRWGNCETGCPDHEGTSPTLEIECDWSGEWLPTDELGKCVCK